MFIGDKQFTALVSVLREYVAVRKDELQWLRSHAVTKSNLSELEQRLNMKLSEIKAAIATVAKQNSEAFAEVSGKIADLQKQIQDLIEGVGDPDVTDEAFLADLQTLQADAQKLADIVPNTPPA